MDFPLEFNPPRSKGYILFLGITLLLLGLSGFLLMFALDQKSSGYFVIALLGAAILFVPVPLVLYNFYSLVRAKYVIDRDGLYLQWGLRTEDVPLNDIEWVRVASEVSSVLPYPSWSFTGILRETRLSDELGEIEFLASDKNRLLLVATSKKIFAISPAQTIDFLNAFQHAFELGSISPIKSQSNQVGTFFSGVFKDRRSRLMVIIGIALTILLFILVGLLIPTRSTVLFGYQLVSGVSEVAPSDRLLIFPVLSLLSLITDLTFGFYLFRHPDRRTLAYMVLSSSSITSFLLLVALLFIR
jgi:hypothetical protein